MLRRPHVASGLLQADSVIASDVQFGRVAQRDVVVDAVELQGVPDGLGNGRGPVEGSCRVAVAGQVRVLDAARGQLVAVGQEGPRAAQAGG
jgi:hypothetical protein